MEPPELDSTETLAGRIGETRGNASFEFREGDKGKVLIVAVRCDGEGTMKVRLPLVKVSFPLECKAEEATTTYNTVGVAGVERKGTVSIEAPSAIRWSVTIGRGDPPVAE